MNENAMLTGKPSIDRPWMKFYPDVLRGIQVPACTVEQYLSVRAADPNVIAMHYYGVDITWGTVFRKVDATARALQVLGIKQGDQIPVFLRSVPEFIYLLLAAERIGASLLCRDNTLEENIEAVQKANAKVIFVHDFFSKAEIEAYREQTNVNTYVIVPALESGDRAAMPVYLQHSLDALYPDVPARGSDTMMWADFCNMGQRFRGFVPAPVNIDRPLLRAYTSGSTGPSKQVIHSAHSIIGVLAQMNFYGSSDKFRPTWLLTILPPALIAVVVSMMLLPLGTGNDFAKKVYGTKKINVENVIKSFGLYSGKLNYTVEPLDLIDYNGEKCINVMSYGLDTKVETIGRKIAGKIPPLGHQAYNIAVVPVMMQPLRYKVNVELDCVDENGNPYKFHRENMEYALFAICNASYYGGGFCPAPDSKLDDGLLDFTYVDPLSLAKAVPIVPRYSAGTAAEYAPDVCLLYTSPSPRD